jgi:hypothetical protein
MIFRAGAVSAQASDCKSSLFLAFIRLVLIPMLMAISLSAGAFGQSVNIAVGSVSGLPGATVTVPVKFSPGAIGVSTLQFDLMFSSSISYSAVSAGAAATNAGKSVSANATFGGVRVLIFGLNQNAVGSGVLANVQMAIPPNAPAGPVPVAITGIVASDPDANQAQASGIGGTVTIQASADTTPLVISGVSSSNVSSSGATITWTTNEASNSQVEYGTTTAYDSNTTLNSSMVTSHSQTLSGLSAGTLYHYRVKSKDAAGNLATSNDYVFTTTYQTASALIFPHFSTGQNGLSTDAMSGIGLVNLNSSPATVTFTAVDEDGNMTAGRDIVNPVTLNLAGREQLPIVDSDVFGSGLLNSNSNGYIKLESTNKDTSGFFLVFDGDLNFQDGANLSGKPLKDFVFSEIQADGYNKISIININLENADLTIDLVGANGIVRNSMSRVITANGSLTVDLFSDLFVGLESHAADYVRVKSSRGVHSFQVMRQKSGDIAMLAGQDATAGGTTLYSPIYVFGGNYRTNLSVINLDSAAGMVSLRLISQNGVQLGASREVAIPANGKLYIDDSGFFMPLDPDVLNGGYVEIISDGIRLSGSIVLGDINRQSFYAALALISSLQDSVLFSHVASDDIYFTGICILNPNTQPTTVRLELYDANGSLREIQYRYIGAKQQQSSLLSQYFISLMNGQNQTSGYVRIFSTVPIASYAAFGTRNLSMISAIPPQVVR